MKKRIERRDTSSAEHVLRMWAMMSCKGNIKIIHDLVHLSLEWKTHGVQVAVENGEQRGQGEKGWGLSISKQMLTYNHPALKDVESPAEREGMKGEHTQETNLPASSGLGRKRQVI